MIITVTGKPCSGKGSVSKLFCKLYNFDYICTGDIFREFSKQSGADILNFQLTDNVKNVDKLVDDRTIEIGKNRINDDVVFDSRLAWHFIPNSFKVFIDVDWDIAAERLFNANREQEQTNSIEQAKELVIKRWQIENDRYQELYGINNLDLNNYDMVISSSNRSVEEICSEIYKKYVEFMQKA